MLKSLILLIHFKLNFLTEYGAKLFTVIFLTQNVFYFTKIIPNIKSIKFQLELLFLIPNADEAGKS